MRHKNYTYEFESEDFKKIKAKNRELIMLFFKNNAYNLKKRGISLYRQIEDLNARSLKLNHSNILKLKKGLQCSTSLTYLHFFCDYWNCELKDMISCDLEEYDKLLGEQK